VPLHEVPGWLQAAGHAAATTAVTAAGP